MRAALVLALLTISGAAAAQELHVSGPLESAPPGPPAPRAFAIGAHATSAGAGAMARVRPWRAFSFEVLGDLRVDRVVPLTGRLTTLLPIDRHDFFFALGPTYHLHRGRDAVGAELAAGLETRTRWWVLRAELAAAMVSGPDRREEVFTVRLGVLHMFGSPIWE